MQNLKAYEVSEMLGRFDEESFNKFSILPRDKRMNILKNLIKIQRDKKVEPVIIHIRRLTKKENESSRA